MTDSRKVAIALAVLMTVTSPADEPRTKSTWGSDHVGKPLAVYVTGDECLFCHRDIGPSWPENRHRLNMRRVPSTSDELSALHRSKLAPDVIRQIQFVLGSSNQARFLKRASAYGKLELLSAKHNLQTGQLSGVEHVSWNQAEFADKCAGCHTTAVESKSRTFAAVGIDCYSCHGDVNLEHTKDTALVYLSKTNRDPKQVASICGQCHLRGGRSRSSGLPYPHHFVAGDNLLRDFAVDLSDQRIGKLDVIEKHIFENVREAESGETTNSCLSCHDVHQNSADKHTGLPESSRCHTCHPNGEFELKLTTPRRRSPVCGY